MADDESSDSVEIAIDQKTQMNGYAVPQHVGLTMEMQDDDGVPHPFIEIIEQPQARGFRFRYECEGPSHGGLQGDRSEKYRKTHPSIKIKNYNGPARVVVTLVTNEVIPRPHAHKLVGKNCNEGSCVMELKSGQNTATFSNLCIQHVTRRKASEVIEQRINESMKLDKLVKLGNLNAQAELSDEEKNQAKAQATHLAKDMQLNVVKLCFQAYLRDESGQFSRLLPSVLSTPIYDSKAPGANALKICRMDKYGGCCTGNEEVFLLCEKVQKDDISVRFVEQDDEGSVIWEAFGNFGPFDVHRQYAIVFKTPAYRDEQIDRPVHVTIMLQRKSDGETSDPKSFTYYPQTFDREEINKKRRKTLPSYPGSSGFGGGNGDNGRSDVSSNGFLNGNLPFHPANEGNIPVMVNQDNAFGFTQSMSSDTAPSTMGMFTIKTDRPSTSDYPSTNHSVIVPNRNRRPPRRKPRADKSDIEVDGSVVPTTVPTVLSEIQPIDIQVSQQHHFILPTIQQFPQQQLQQPPNFQFSSGFPLQFNSQGLIPRGGGGGRPSVNKLDKITEKSNSQTNGAVAVCDDAIVEASVDEIDAGKFVCPLSELQDHSVIEFTKSEALPLRENEIDIQNSQESVSNITMALSPRSYHEAKTCSVGCQTEAVAIETNLSARTNVNTQDTYVQTEKDGVIRTAERTVSALQNYAVTGDIRQLLMVQRYLTSVCDENGDLPLHTSIINGQLEVVHNLLDVMGTLPNSWLKINSYNNLLQTPLHLAVLTQQAGIVDRLLCARANPALPDRNGNTATHLAVQNGANNCLDVLLRPLRLGSTSDTPFPELNMKNFCGFSPAHIAVQKGNQHAITCIVRGKGDINLADGKTGRTPLHYAVEADNLSIAGYLIFEAGASVNETCFNGNTALHIACGKQNVGMVALLMAVGADPNLENSEEIHEDNPDDDGEKIPKRGHKPQDYSHNNEKVLRVLRGEPYTVSDDVMQEASNRVLEQMNKNFSSLSLNQSYSGLSSMTVPGENGDIDRILYPVRVHLSKLLDPKSEGKDWLALAEKLGLRKVLEGQEAGFSPTRLLLTYYESCGGTVQRLLSALRSLGRVDAACLITDTLNLQGEDCKSLAFKSGSPRSVDVAVDSGRSLVVPQMAAS